MSDLICDVCHKPSPRGLYAIAVGPNEGKYGCFGCVPDAQKDMYPNWQADEDLARKRAETARENFKQTEGVKQESVETGDVKTENVKTENPA